MKFTAIWATFLFWTAVLASKAGPAKKDVSRTKFLFPTNGHSFAPGDRIKVKWTGEASNEKLRLFLERDDGEKGFTIAAKQQLIRGEHLWYLDDYNLPGQLGSVFRLILLDEHFKALAKSEDFVIHNKREPQKEIWAMVEEVSMERPELR